MYDGGASSRIHNGIPTYLRCRDGRDLRVRSVGAALGGGGALDVLNQITDENRYTFDQACRVKAITLASQLGMQSLLSINFLPNAVYQPASGLHPINTRVRSTRWLPIASNYLRSHRVGTYADPDHLASIFAEYKRHGMLTAIDDFGAGHSGLKMPAQFPPAGT